MSKLSIPGIVDPLTYRLDEVTCDDQTTAVRIEGVRAQYLCAHQDERAVCPPFRVHTEKRGVCELDGDT